MAGIRAAIRDFGLACLGIFMFCLYPLVWLTVEAFDLVWAIVAFVTVKCLDGVLTVLRFRLRIFC